MTVTTSIKSLPVQFAAEGVTIYVAVCGLLVPFVNVPEITDPFPAAPIIPPVVAGADQE